MLGKVRLGTHTLLLVGLVSVYGDLLGFQFFLLDF